MTNIFSPNPEDISNIFSTHIQGDEKVLIQLNILKTVYRTLKFGTLLEVCI
jgi:hypothetical protein